MCQILTTIVKHNLYRYYFASGGSDRTAKLWTVSSAGPLRHFVGHLSDIEIVDFHPNGLYIITSANDRTIRLYK
jgi:transcription initiation factor TFIID subunit 5